MARTLCHIEKLFTTGDKFRIDGKCYTVDTVIGACPYYIQGHCTIAKPHKSCIATECQWLLENHENFTIDFNCD